MNMESNRLFLLDAYALIYRAYYAMIRSPRITSKGFNTSAIFGFCNTLREVLRKENPSHIAVCFDPAGPTFRHEIYEEYKAGRDKQPEDITDSLPWIKKILEALRIPCVEIAGYEADDVIGTLSRIAEKEGYITYMMTPDKDYGQLVTDRVLMYRPSLRGEGFEIRGPKEVCERYGINEPKQVIDLLALEGDSSDNIPGCPGVGEKTASKLIAVWGSVENLIAHTDDLKGAIKKKIEENSEQIIFSKFLATIKTDVPLGDISPEMLVRQEIDYESLFDIYRQLEFKSFIQKLEQHVKSDKKPEVKKKTEKKGVDDDGFVGSLFNDLMEEENLPTNDISTTNHDYSVIETEEEITAFLAEAMKQERVGVSFDAPGENAMAAMWHGLAFATEPGKAFYIPLDSFDSPQRVELLRPFFRSETEFVSHNVKRDMVMMHREGIIGSCPYFDTSVAHYLIDPEMKHTLDFVASKYLGYSMIQEAKGRGAKPMTQSERREAACEAADVSLRLRPILSSKLKEMDLEDLYRDIELPLIEVLGVMEYTGVRVDTNELIRLNKNFSERLDQMEKEIHDLAGEPFNISSPAQVGMILFDKLEIDSSAKKTKKGTYSTTEEILEKLRPKHPIVDLILRYRALKKLLTTYVSALPALVNPRTGKIHTLYNQTGTATGRISSANPNLQNIPIRSEDGKEIRRAFIADRDNILMSADYSQIELRLIADISGDPGMIEAFREGADIHRATAAKIYHEKPEDVTDTQRRNAKTANFGIAYGISAFGLSERLGIPRAEAKMLIDGYFRSYPAIRAYMENTIESARENGYVKTIMGRKRFLPDINSRSGVVRSYAERNAINAPIQGSAADIIKKAMVDIFRHIGERGMKSRMIMQVHDELVFNVVPSELPELERIVVTDMVNAYHGKVNMEVAAGTGRNWLEAH